MRVIQNVVLYFLTHKRRLYEASIHPFVKISSRVGYRLERKIREIPRDSTNSPMGETNAEICSRPRTDPSGTTHTVTRSDDLQTTSQLHKPHLLVSQPATKWLEVRENYGSVLELIWQFGSLATVLHAPKK